jgi:hypothetical protein
MPLLSHYFLAFPGLHLFNLTLDPFANTPLPPLLALIQPLLLLSLTRNIPHLFSVALLLVLFSISLCTPHLRFFDTIQAFSFLSFPAVRLFMAMCQEVN